MSPSQNSDTVRMRVAASPPGSDPRAGGSPSSHYVFPRVSGDKSDRSNLVAVYHTFSSSGGVCLDARAAMWSNYCRGGGFGRCVSTRRRCRPCLCPDLDDSRDHPRRVVRLRLRAPLDNLRSMRALPRRPRCAREQRGLVQRRALAQAALLFGRPWALVRECRKGYGWEGDCCSVLC